MNFTTADANAIAKMAPGAKAQADRDQANYAAWAAQHDAHMAELDAAGFAAWEAVTPCWTELEGQLILQIKGQPVAALPVSGKRNAAHFVAFNVETRKELCQLRKSEVYGWLRRVAQSAADQAP